MASDAEWERPGSQDTSRWGWGGRVTTSRVWRLPGLPWAGEKACEGVLRGKAETDAGS